MFGCQPPEEEREEDAEDRRQDGEYLHVGASPTCAGFRTATIATYKQAGTFKVAFQIRGTAKVRVKLQCVGAQDSIVKEFTNLTNAWQKVEFQVPVGKNISSFELIFMAEKQPYSSFDIKRLMITK